MNIPCLSGCHPHPLYVWRGVEWPGRGTKRGWMSRSVKTFRFRGRFLSSSDFSRMARPVPPKLLAMSPLPLTPSFTRAIGSTLDVVGVGDNRIGTEHTNPHPPTAARRRALALDDGRRRAGLACWPRMSRGAPASPRRLVWAGMPIAKNWSRGVVKTGAARSAGALYRRTSNSFIVGVAASHFVTGSDTGARTSPSHSALRGTSARGGPTTNSRMASPRRPRWACPPKVVTPPGGPVVTPLPKVVTHQPGEPKRDRAAYMRAYRTNRKSRSGKK